MVDYIPAGMTPVTPYLTIEGAEQALSWYEKVFGAERGHIMAGEDGKLMHGEMRLFGGTVMLSDAWPDYGIQGPKGRGGTTVTVHLYVPDCDGLYQKATAAGAESLQEPNDAFWGVRFAKIRDPFGHEWSIATQIKAMTEAEVTAAGQAWARENMAE